MEPDYLLFISSLSLSFFCSCSETAMFSLSHITIEDIKIKHKRRGEILQFLLNHPQKLLLTILICNIFANIFATLTATRIFEKNFSNCPVWLPVIIITIILLIFGETTPKSIAVYFNRSISILVSPVFYFLSKLFTPVIFILNKVATLLVNINSAVFFRNISEKAYYHPDEIMEVIRTSKSQGIIEETEGDLLRNIVEFTRTDIWKIKRQRDEIVSAPIDITINELILLIKDTKFSRLPIWENTEENIIGILHAKDLLKINENKRKLSYYRYLLKPVLFVPESTEAEELLNIFRTKNLHMALTIDEYGGISGLVTLEDIIEIVLGDVIDKDDVVPMYHTYSTDMIEAEGRMPLDDFNDVFGTELKSSQTVTIAGYILEKINRIPIAGEIFTFDDLHFKISGAQPHKIEKILVTKKLHIQKRKNQGQL